MNSRITQIILGVGIIVLGLFALNFLGGALSANSVFGQYWPIILIFVGLLSIGASGEHIGFSLGIMGVGLVLLLDRLGLFNQTRWLEAFILVMIGFAVIALVAGKPRNKKEPAAKTHDRIVE